MKKSEAIDLLNKEGWTKADAQRVLKSLDFKRDNSINEIMILRAASKFAGAELLERQRLQAAQKTVATKRKNKIASYLLQIEELKRRRPNSSENQTDILQQLKQLTESNQELLQANQKLQAEIQDSTHAKQNGSAESFNPDFKQQIKKLSDQNKELLKANRSLQKDNKDLKNVTDAIKLRLTQETKHLLRLENSQIKKGLMKLLNSVLG